MPNDNNRLFKNIKKKKLNYQHLRTITINNHKIHYIKQVKSLRLIITKNFSWKNHNNMISKRVYVSTIKLCHLPFNPSLKLKKTISIYKLFVVFFSSLLDLLLSVFELYFK